PAGVADHEGDALGGDLLGGDDEVALVLPVGVVDDDDELPPGDGGDRLVDGRERHVAQPSLVWLMRRSTYLATRSTSRLTGSPGPLIPRVVTVAVWGIRANSKVFSPTPATVRLTPSTAIEPFSTTQRRTAASAATATRVEPSARASFSAISPT